MIEFSFRTRAQNLERMAHEEFDLLVVGGGIHGAGVARDAALRGLRVALVEKGDFASGTSSKSSKLIHGGLRYLEHFEFGLVAGSCRERHVLMRIAPHLVKSLSFLLPIYRNDPRPPWMIRAGMLLYETLSAFRNVGRHRMIGPEEAVREEPVLNPEGLLAAAEYWDCQENDARFCLANVVDASAHGAVCANYTEVVKLESGTRPEDSATNRIERACIEDRISHRQFKVRAKIFVNAGGPWVDRIAMLEPSPPSIRLRPTKGIHLVTRRLTQRHALLLQTRRDQRVFFVLPWGKDHSLIGTTDTDFKGDPDRVEATPEDVEYLLAETNHALPSLDLTEKDVQATFAGLRPLLEQRGRSPSDVTRRHKLAVSSRGLISIVGGKYTAYRAVAEEVVTACYRRIQNSTPPCRTATEPLAPEFPAELDDLKTGGSSAGSAGENSPYANAVRHAVNHEMAVHLDDFLFRRTTLGYCSGKESIARHAAAEMQKLLGWSQQETEEQVRDCLARR